MTDQLGILGQANRQDDTACHTLAAAGEKDPLAGTVGQCHIEKANCNPTTIVPAISSLFPPPCIIQIDCAPVILKTADQLYHFMGIKAPSIARLASWLTDLPGQVRPQKQCKGRLLDTHVREGRLRLS